MSVLPVDEAARQQAAVSLDKNVIVLAGAGTGKTRLLIDRLTLLILGKRIPVERLVALTFTKKAGEEMRVRLEERLRAVINGDVPALLQKYYPENQATWKDLARTALDDIPKAQIGTIHSFAAHLLRLYPLQAGVDPAFREDEGTLFENIFEREWMTWLKSELGESSPRRSFWRGLLKDVPLSDLRDLSVTLASPLTNINNLTASVSIKDAASGLKNELAGLLQGVVLPSARQAPAFMEGLSAWEKILDAVMKGAPVPSRCLKTLQALTPIQRFKEKAAELKNLKNRTMLLGSVDEAALDKSIQAVLPFVKNFRKELNRKGAVSFEGLLVHARNLLKCHCDVRAELKKRFDAFLVDEFQDTDPVQGEILFYLSEHSGSAANNWKEVSLEPGRLFVVGDPKQSIYRFRGAEMAAFEAFQNHLIRDGALEITLFNNFRSVRPLLHFVNHVFPFVMREERFLQPPYVALETSRDGQAELAIEMVWAEKKNGELLSAQEGRECEAEVVASWISENLGKPQGFTNDHPPLRYSDIAILFRSSHAFSPYLEALRQRNIPYIVEGEKSFYLTPEVVDFINLLSIVADPRDTMALVGVLRSPVGGLTDGEILDLKENNALDFRQPLPVHGEKTAGLFRLLHEFSMSAAHMPVPQVVQDVLNRSFIRELTLPTVYGEQAAANLSKIVSLAKKWSDEAPLTLKSFVRRLRNYREEERKEGENPLADVSYDAVKVLTIHKAKGLEFPVVFLPNLSAGLNRGADKPSVARDWQTGLLGLRLPKSKKTNASMFILDQEADRKEDAEEVRVFFVAATRAKNKMIMLASHTRNPGRFASYLRAGNVYPEGGGDRVVFGDFNVPIKSVEWKDENGKRNMPPPVPLSEVWNPVSLSKLWNARQKTWEELRTQPSVLTPSRLAKEDEKLRPYEPDDPGVLASAPLILGGVCHKVMEEWEFNISSKKMNFSLDNSLEGSARLFELIPQTRLHNYVTREARDVLTHFFQSEEYRRLAKVKIWGREIPFCYSINEGQDGPRLVRGVIDLLYEENGQIVVADYKTNRVTAGFRDKVVETYRPQGVAYQQAVRASLGKECVFELIFLREGTSVRL